MNLNLKSSIYKQRRNFIQQRVEDSILKNSVEKTGKIKDLELLSINRNLAMCVSHCNPVGKIFYLDQNKKLHLKVQTKREQKIFDTPFSSLNHSTNSSFSLKYANKVIFIDKISYFSSTVCIGRLLNHSNLSEISFQTINLPKQFKNIKKIDHSTIKNQSFIFYEKSMSVLCHDFSKIIFSRRFKSEPLCLSFLNEKETVIATGHRDGCVRLWDSRVKENIQMFCTNREPNEKTEGATYWLHSLKKSSNKQLVTTQNWLKKTNQPGIRVFDIRIVRNNTSLVDMEFSKGSYKFETPSVGCYEKYIVGYKQSSANVLFWNLSNGKIVTEMANEEKLNLDFYSCERNFELYLKNNKGIIKKSFVFT